MLIINKIIKQLYFLKKQLEIYPNTEAKLQQKLQELL